jgi:hypothetical protein
MRRPALAMHFFLLFVFSGVLKILDKFSISLTFFFFLLKSHRERNH